MLGPGAVPANDSRATDRATGGPDRVSNIDTFSYLIEDERDLIVNGLTYHHLNEDEVRRAMLSGWE
jgi:hypothetical protein